LPPLRQPQQDLSPVGRRGLAVDEPLLLEAAQDPTQVPRIDAQLPAEVGRGGLVVVRQLVQHAHLGEGERASQQPFV
jgi:hypothetical protein